VVEFCQFMLQLDFQGWETLAQVLWIA